jgi:membrane protein
MERDRGARVRLRTAFGIVKTAVVCWFVDGAPSMGAAIAFYALFSLAPMLMLVIQLAGLAFGEQEARGELFVWLAGLVGSRGAAAIAELLNSFRTHGSGTLAAILGIVIVLLAATAMFTELRGALNQIWRLEPTARFRLWPLLLGRLVGLLVIVAMSLLFLLSLLAGSALTALGGYLGGLVPELPRLLRIAELLLTFVLTTLACLVLFAVLPDTRPGWRAICLGAVAASLLFTLGKYLISLYIGSSYVTSAYGAAGGLVVLLLWIYYSAQILLFGAELAKAYGDWRQAMAAKADPAPVRP